MQIYKCQISNYFNLNIKFYFNFKLLTHSTLSKLNRKIYFFWQVILPARQKILSKSISDRSLGIKNA